MRVRNESGRRRRRIRWDKSREMILKRAREGVKEKPGREEHGVRKVHR